MREKYVEERFPSYFIFGSSEEGKVDVASIDNDTVVTVTKEQADIMILSRYSLVDMLVKLALDEENQARFLSIWYDGGK